MGPLAQGQRQRRHGRAEAARLDAGRRARRAPFYASARAAGSPRRGGRAAASAHATLCAQRRAACATSRPRSTRWRIAARRRPGSTPAPGARCGDAGDLPARPAARRRPLALRSTPRRWPSALEILGRPVVDLAVSPRSARARCVAVRLCDVAPDGASTLVTRGVLNLTPPRRPRGSPSRSCPAGATRVTVAAEGGRARRSRPATASALAISTDATGPGSGRRPAGDAHGGRRREPAAAAGAAAARRRRAAPVARLGVHCPGLALRVDPTADAGVLRRPRPDRRAAHDRLGVGLLRRQAPGVRTRVRLPRPGALHDPRRRPAVCRPSRSAGRSPSRRGVADAHRDDLSHDGGRGHLPGLRRARRVRG